MSAGHRGWIRSSVALVSLITFTWEASSHPLVGLEATPTKAAASSRIGAATGTVPADTILRVRLNGRLSSATARVGESFQTTVTEAVSIGGIVRIPAGSTISGRISKCESAQPGLRLGVLGLHFTMLRTPDGATYPIDGSLTSVSGETVNFDASGRAQGRAVKRRDTVFIGVPTAVLTRSGALAQAAAVSAEFPVVGPIIAAILAAVAAVLVLVGSMLAKAKEDEAAAKEEKTSVKKSLTPIPAVTSTNVAKVRADVELGPDTQFGVLLNQAVALPR